MHGLKYCDVIGDGFRELTVLSTRGVHIFQVSEYLSTLNVLCHIAGNCG